VTITSPNYPARYGNDENCTWTVKATSGKIRMVFTSFNIEGNSRCSKDYLKVSGPIKKYRTAKMCGSSIPSNFNLQSKRRKMVLKFVSNSSKRKSGFSAYLVAT